MDSYTAMRIFSNIHLHWTKVQVITCVARRYPGYVMGIYLYRIKDTIPTTRLETHAPLDLLRENRLYYCYHRIGFRQGTQFPTNSMYKVFLPNEGCAEIYLPYSISSEDVIAVQDHIHPKPQEVFLPGIFMLPPLVFTRQ